MSKSQSETGSGIEDRQGKYLTFQLDSETYGLTILLDDHELAEF